MKEILERKINDIFLEQQIKNNIESGDIEPLDAIKLDKLVDELTELITKVLEYQKD